MPQKRIVTTAMSHKTLSFCVWHMAHGTGHISQQACAICCVCVCVSPKTNDMYNPALPPKTCFDSDSDSDFDSGKRPNPTRSEASKSKQSTYIDTFHNTMMFATCIRAYVHTCHTRMNNDTPATDIAPSTQGRTNERMNERTVVQVKRR